MIALKNGDYIDAGYIRAVFVEAERNIAGYFSPAMVVVVTANGSHRSSHMSSYQSACDEAHRINTEVAKAKEQDA